MPNHQWLSVQYQGNQFRALEEDEVLFLDSLAEKQREEERLRKEMEGEELKNFRQWVSFTSLTSHLPRQAEPVCTCRAVAARDNAAKPPPVTTERPSGNTVKAKAAPAAPAGKRDAKKSLKGVLVKKKSKPAPDGASGKDSKAATQPPSKSDDIERPPTKKRRVDDQKS